MTLEKSSPCKINLLLNVLGKRADGFHALETVMQPVPLFDEIVFERNGSGVQLTCDHPGLPVDGTNLVFRAAKRFFECTGITEGVKLHLKKRIPLAAGVGGGSGNAAVTLLGLNDLFDQPLDAQQLERLAVELGSDVPFFLQKGPALGTGRGEIIQPLKPFPALGKKGLLLIHPGFGVSTPWAYKALAKFPTALNGRPGQGQELIELLGKHDFAPAASRLYNSLEAPVLNKYPLLALYQEHLKENGALAVLMSGSGSTTFAIASDQTAAHVLADAVRSRFGTTTWVTTMQL